MNKALEHVRRGKMAIFAQRLAVETKVPSSLILSHNRDPGVVALRHRLWSMLHDDGWSINCIAHVAGFDHTTVRAGLIAYRCKLTGEPRPVRKTQRRKSNVHDCTVCWGEDKGCEGCDGSGELADCRECDEPMPAPEAERKGWLCDGCREGLERGDQAAEVERIRRVG